MKGHAKDYHIQCGITTEEDKQGNDGADGLATAGAQLHPVDEDVLLRAACRQRGIGVVRRMMPAVLEQRWKDEPAALVVQQSLQCEADPG